LVWGNITRMHLLLEISGSKASKAARGMLQRQRQNEEASKSDRMQTVPVKSALHGTETSKERPLLPACGLFSKLAPELRNAIYEYALPEDHEIDVDRHFKPPGDA
jgi:hypothetical protein